MYRERKLEESLKQRAVRALAARRSRQTALGMFLKFVQQRTLLLVEVVEIDGAVVAYSIDYFVQGFQHHKDSQLLDAVTDRWPSFSCSGSNKCLGSSSCGGVGTFILFFADNVHAFVRASDMKKEGSCPTACATSPMLVGRDLSIRKWSDGSVLTLAPAAVWKRKSGISITLPQQ